MTLNANKRLTKIEKIILVIALNVLVAFTLVGIFIWNMPGQEVATKLAFFQLIPLACYVFYIPFIGKFKPSLKFPLAYIVVITFIVKFALILAMESLIMLEPGRPYFLGSADYEMFLENAILYFRGERGIHPPTPTTGAQELFYPPGTALMWLFIYLINPSMNTLLFRTQLLFFELGIVYVTYKITEVKKLEIDREGRHNVVIYCLFAFSFLIWFDTYGKPDCIVVLLTLTGYYLLLKDRVFMAALVFSFVGFIKLYTFLWLLGFVILYLKKKDLKTIAMIISGAAVPAVIILPIDYYFQQLAFFMRLFQFGWQLSQVYAIYNQNVWFFFTYLGIPFANVIPYLLFLGLYVIFTFKWKRGITPEFITITIALALFCYPALNVQYYHWMVPFIALYFLNSKRKTRYVALLEYLAMMIEVGFTLYVPLTGGSIADAIYLDPTIMPRWDYLAWRFASLGLLLFSLLLIITPNLFDPYLFPERTQGLVLELPRHDKKGNGVC